MSEGSEESVILSVAQRRDESGATDTRRAGPDSQVADGPRGTASRLFALAQNDSGGAVRHEASSAVVAASNMLLILGAPAAAIIAGVAAERVDFRAMRYPILLMMLAGVVATAYALDWRAAERGDRRAVPGAMLRSVLLGVVTWGAAQTLYFILHVALGERFDAPRFGQPLQALGLIAAHALFLGAPTGLVAGAILNARTWLLRGARR
jgi:hypothetical protein